MEALLFLAHRIPFPPNKGDKIRSYHFVRQLTEHYQVYLGAFIDDPNDLQYASTVCEMVEQAHLVNLNPLYCKLKSLGGLVRGEALTLPYYRHALMQSWVDSVVQQKGISKGLIFSSAMAQFVIDKPDMRCFTDFVDVDSDKWRQYADKKSWPSSFIYQREAEKLLHYERLVSAQSKASFFVSEQEAKLFQNLAPESADRIDFVNNGVDTEYFAPENGAGRPYPSDRQVIVFSGAMDYWANVDAVCWFVQEIFPRVRQGIPNAWFYIVGSKPSREVLNLAKQNQVEVTGRVEDMRPYLSHADLVVAPLRVARGIQNKVLEALAMDKPLVVTSAAMEGINGHAELHLSVEDEPKQFAAEVVNYLQSDQHGNPKINRVFVQDHFSWARSGMKLEQALSGA